MLLASKTTALHLRYEMFSGDRKIWIGILEILQQTVSTIHTHTHIQNTFPIFSLKLKVKLLVSYSGY